MAKILTYKGDSLEKKQSYKNSDNRDVIIDNYNPSPDLIDAVNLTLALNKRPLLLMGEPGCGKTRLAEAVAYELHKEKMDKHFFQWHIKSTTKAKEGIYRYDALKRLYHANTHNKDIENIENYIEHGELLKAFTSKQNGELPNILLIDEIDKADIDFPNDLLLELDKKQFIIPELEGQGTKEATSDVIIFITSNREKELPPAFLRRCLYHFIKFPDQKKLLEIVTSHFENTNEPTVNNAIKAFVSVREEIAYNDKKPSTSELLDWFSMIDYYGKLENDKREKTEGEKRLINELKKLGTEQIPFKQLLLKTEQSNQAFSIDE